MSNRCGAALTVGFMVAQSGARVRVGDPVAWVRYDDGLTQDLPLAGPASGCSPRGRRARAGGGASGLAAGFTIVDRSSTPLAPTADGREFIREALQILRIAQATEAAHEE
jgi:hypothetical protein